MRGGGYLADFNSYFLQKDAPFPIAGRKSAVAPVQDPDARTECKTGKTRSQITGHVRVTRARI